LEQFSPRASFLSQLAEQRLLLRAAKFGPVSPLELLPSLRIVAEPPPQVMAGSQVFEPCRGMGVFLPQPSRQETLDQVALAVLGLAAFRRPPSA
jgi:hypothetical protein